MRWQLAIVGLAACGRLGFDAVPGGTKDNIFAGRRHVGAGRAPVPWPVMTG